MFFQIIEWFEQYAEEFFETHTDLGESLEVAQALVNELMEFEESTKVSVALITLDYHRVLFVVVYRNKWVVCYANCDQRYFCEFI